jgi:hypothetical protein
MTIDEARELANNSGTLQSDMEYQGLNFEIKEFNAAQRNGRFKRALLKKKNILPTSTLSPKGDSKGD